MTLDADGLGERVALDRVTRPVGGGFRSTNLSIIASCFLRLLTDMREDEEMACVVAVVSSEEFCFLELRRVITRPAEAGAAQAVMLGKISEVGSSIRVLSLLRVKRFSWSLVPERAEKLSDL